MSELVEVASPVTVLEIETVDQEVVTVVDAGTLLLLEIGLTGPKGDPGIGGGAGAGYVHTQALAATVWDIPHDLGYDPAGIVVTSGGFVLDGFGIQYMVAGEDLRLSFDISVSGTAYLS